MKSKRPWAALLSLVIIAVSLGAYLGCGFSPQTSKETKQHGITHDALNVPNGYGTEIQGNGATLYKKIVPGGTPDHVIHVQMDKATLKSIVGTQNSQGKISKQSLQSYWIEAQANTPNGTVAFATFNGQFFDTGSNPTGLAFGVKKDGVIISTGYGTNNEFTTQQHNLQWNNTEGWAFLVSGGQLLSTPPDQVVGLEPYANKNSNSFVGRTFVGLSNPNSSGKFLDFFIYVSKTASQADARNALTAFGSQQIVMLDGGDSSQLIVRGQSYVSSTRPIPHAIAIYEQSASSTSQLSNGQSVFGSLSQNQEKQYTITVPSGASSLKVETTGSGDVDLYVKSGTPPTLSDYNCRPYTSSSNETCNMNNPASGVWYILVRGFSTSSSYTLKATYAIGSQNSGSTFTQLLLGHSVSSYVSLDAIHQYKFEMNSGVQYTVTLSPNSGDPDLYTNNTSNISLNNYLCRPYHSGTTIETCTFVAPFTGTNYILVHGYQASSYSIKYTSP